MGTRRQAVRLSAAAAAATVAAVPALGAVDNLRILVDKDLAAGTRSLGSAAWQPGDAYYTATFGTATAAVGFFKISPNGSGGQTAQLQISDTELRTFYNDGDQTRGTGVPVVSGIVLNPVAVGAFPAYSFAVVTDIAQTTKPGSSTNDPDFTKRIYRYNLQQVTNGDGRQVLTSLVTLRDVNAAKGVALTNTSSNLGRQGAFSTDGKSYYFIDSQTTLGGIYKTDVLAGGATKLLDFNGINTEPAVLPLAGGGDRILFAGTAATGNDGGVNEIEHNGSTTSGQKTFVSAVDLGAFLERAAGTADVRSIATDAAGNVYFFDTTSKVLVRRDPQGRLSKVTTGTERNALVAQTPGKTGTVNGNQLRLQPRTVVHPTAGPLTEIVYTEQTTQNFVAGAYAFAAGDFNRDGTVGPADALLLKPVLTRRGVVQTNSDNFKFDLNGNAVVDWKDVKVFQQFFAFDDGDATIDRAVDYADLDIIAGGYPRASAATWIQGDFTGDDAVNLADLTILAANWDLATPTKAQFDARGYTGAFRSDLETAFGLNVPEPTSAAAVAAGALGLLARRRRAR